MRLELLTADVPLLFPFLETVYQDGGKKMYGVEGKIGSFRNYSGHSGFTYEEDGITSKLSFAIILGNTGYVLRRSFIGNGQEAERFDHYNISGELTFTSDKETLNVIIVDDIDIEVTCPILNHLYNFLNLEYRHATEGKSRTELVFFVEKYLRRLEKSKTIHLPIQEGINDPAIMSIYRRILETEMDPVLSWEERHLVFANHKEKRDMILATKQRAHKKSRIILKWGVLRKNLTNFLERFMSRPASNTQGLFYKYTVGKVIWFFQTVKNNLGYSVALAVYGPFTYYFITMPMNPHAMQAVGRVRSAYLDIKTEISGLIDRDSVVIAAAPVVNPQTPREVLPETTSVDDVSTISAASIKTDSAQDKILANIIYPSESTLGPVRTANIDMGEGSMEKHKPTFLNMLISTDVAKVNQQSWFDRMSSFKQMQIAYEENIDYASRMGRLEQLETQYNFPMQIESTWEELERYNNAIFKARAETPNLSAKMKQYLTNEINRTQQIQLYLWDRMARFILDQPYVMLDEDKEQKRNDYYVGRSFVFMQEMTNILSWRYKSFKRPVGYEKIDALANFYSGARKEHGSVMKNLQANSDLFKQKDIYNTAEFRSYMKRQWEILFLQNSKAEEASNNGLNMYIWSTRNTVWILQSIFSAKRDELVLLVKRDSSGNIFTPAELLTRSKISMMYETFLHNLTLEYVGIREEIMKRLGKDIESTQRMSVIENLKEFLSDREKLDGLNVINDQKTAGTKI